MHNDPIYSVEFLTGPLEQLEAFALAELCKRIGFDDCRRLAVDAEEARAMVDATVKLRRALEAVGIRVR